MFLLALATVFAALPTYALSHAKSESLSMFDLKGQRWPFSAEKGVLECHPGNVIVFVAGGRTYTVNGTADAHAKHYRLPWRDAREIWKDDPLNPGAKVPITPVISRGLALCAKS